jgi:hypothetical protein
MKITEQSLCFFVEDPQFVKFHLNNVHSEITSINNGDRNLFQIYMFKESVLTDKTNRMLIFSDRSKDNLSEYHVSKNIRFDVLRLLPNRRDIIQVDDITCIKYIKTDNLISVIVLYRDKGKIIPTYTFMFFLDLRTKKVYHDNYDYLKMSEVTYKELVEKYFNMFMVTISYLELTEVTLKVINGRTNTGDKTNGSHIKNLTKNKVIQVNSNWNVRVVRLNSFPVRKHLRLQKCGKGLSEVKPIWIDEYIKGPMRRLSQKEVYNNVS